MLKHLVPPLLLLLCVLSSNVQGFAQLGQVSIRSGSGSLELCQASSDGDADDQSSLERRQFLAAAIIGIVATPQLANARYMMDEETGDYIEVDDQDWQTAWKQRLDKAQTMSSDEIFKAARGAGNLELKTGPESEASRKRRAISACRDADIRAKAGAGNERDCTARVLAGDIAFLLD